MPARTAKTVLANAGSTLARGTNDKVQSYPITIDDVRHALPVFLIAGMKRSAVGHVLLTGA